MGYGINAEEIHFNAITIDVAGSGAGEVNFGEGDVLSNLVADSSPPEVVAALINHFINAELTDPFYEHLSFGGAYEIFGCRPGGGFYRIPYTVAEFSNRDHESGVENEEVRLTRFISCRPHQQGAVFEVSVFSGDAGSQRRRYHEVAVEPLVDSGLFPETPIGQADVNFMYIMTGAGSYISSGSTDWFVRHHRGLAGNVSYEVNKNLVGEIFGKYLNSIGDNIN
ncbi:hypothetical protein JSE7799_02172 [Jannaschia seosinensis]|uniref:Uncharacterized protein n=2 Tax=Jannaschia seosinensis TaxID=313367 RepID=A0A0M7BDL8_9RHOB|nr:hypothetical protein JSE7799_02172 [Jannaschia seosinensis]